MNSRKNRACTFATPAKCPRRLGGGGDVVAEGRRRPLAAASCSAEPLGLHVLCSADGEVDLRTLISSRTAVDLKRRVDGFEEGSCGGSEEGQSIPVCCQWGEEHWPPGRSTSVFPPFRDATTIAARRTRRGAEVRSSPRLPSCAGRRGSSVGRGGVGSSAGDWGGRASVRGEGGAVDL